MPTRSNVFFQGNYYHVFNRGVNKQAIFLSSENYRYCLNLVSKYTLKHEITVIAYCMMPNHYHFLLRQNGEIPISEFIQVIFNSYAQSFNRRHDRTGALFGGRFKHRYVDKDSYVLQLCRYIHLNPVEAGLVNSPNEWEYSDYREWIGKGLRCSVDSEFIKQYFDKTNEYESFVIEYMRERRKDGEILGYLID